MSRLFQERNIIRYFNEYRDSIVNHINRLSEKELLSMNVDEFMKGLFERFPLEAPVIDFGHEGKKIIEEKNVPYQFAQYTFPYTGNQELLLCSPVQPAAINMIQTDIEINSNDFVMKLDTKSILDNNQDELKRIKELHDRYVERIKSNLLLIDNDVELAKKQIAVAVNKHIQDKIKEIVDRKRSESML